VAEMLKQYENNPQHSLVKASILHVQFEKIHPFLDGNGRVGRLLIHQSLKNEGLSFDGLLGFENFIESNKDEYYSLLANESNDVTEMSLFLCRAILSDTQAAIEQRHELKSAQQEELRLLPRRQEIINIIRDHQMVSFDMLHRRFMAVPVSTLRNDLLQLQKGGFVTKMGKTRGVWYTNKT
jgi:Fic family protein